MHVTHIYTDGTFEHTLCGKAPEPKVEGESTALCSECHLKTYINPPSDPRAPEGTSEPESAA